jgi:hypothetical protein
MGTTATIGRSTTVAGTSRAAATAAMTRGFRATRAIGATADKGGRTFERTHGGHGLPFI